MVDQVDLCRSYTGDMNSKSAEGFKFLNRFEPNGPKGFGCRSKSSRPELESSTHR